MILYYNKTLDKIYHEISELKKDMGNKEMSDSELSEVIYNSNSIIYFIDVAKLKCMTDLENNNKKELIHDYRTYERVLSIKFGKQEIITTEVKSQKLKKGN